MTRYAFSAGNQRAFGGCRALMLLSALMVLVLGAARDVRADQEMERRIRDLGGTLDGYVNSAMQSFDNPGLVIGIVTGDSLHFAKGYGVGRKGGEPVDARTVFQIGSTTKAFLATTMAIAADRQQLAWDTRVVDLIAQRSGMPPFANDAMGLLGVDQAGMVRAMRFVEPVSSFRSSFAYTNVTHMLAQRIVARQFGEPDWDSVLRKEIFEALDMQNSSLTAEALEAAPNRSWGHRWTPQGSVEVPFTPIFPSAFGAAGAINSTVENLASWVRLHLADGMFEGKRIVSAENLAVTKMPRVQAVLERLRFWSSDFSFS